MVLAFNVISTLRTGLDAAYRVAHGMPMPVVSALDARADIAITLKLISTRPTGLHTSVIVAPARVDSADMAIIPKHSSPRLTVLYTGLILHRPCLTVRARGGQAEMTAN